MTPSACSLYDKIKLYRLNNGCNPATEDVSGNNEDLKELVDNGFIRIQDLKVDGFYSQLKIIELLK